MNMSDLKILLLGGDSVYFVAIFAVSLKDLLRILTIFSKFIVFVGFHSKFLGLEVVFVRV